ncbi:MAG: hypothetical protein AB8I08_27935 [Sandaracinaceae bacterium]
MRTRLQRAHVVLVILTVALVGLGCSDASGTWVEHVASRSAEAENAAPDVAERALRDIVEREVPNGIAAEDRRVVHQDAYDRLAQLALDDSDLDAAERHVGAGLALGVREDLFSANLLTTRGRIHEARGRDREAAADYHLALRISEALLEQVLSGE